MTVSAAIETGCAAPTLGISPGDVLVGCVFPAGGGEVKPPDGISPAIIGAESTHASAIAIRNRFILVSPFEGLMMQDFLHLGRIEQHPEFVARLGKGD